MDVYPPPADWMLDTGSWMLALSVEGDGDFVITIPMALPSGEVISILKKDCFGFRKKLNPRNDME